MNEFGSYRIQRIWFIHRFCGLICGSYINHCLQYFMFLFHCPHNIFFKAYWFFLNHNKTTSNFTLLFTIVWIVYRSTTRQSSHSCSSRSIIPPQYSNYHHQHIHVYTRSFYLCFRPSSSKNSDWVKIIKSFRWLSAE